MVFRLQPWCSLLLVGVVVVLGVCAGVGETIPPPICFNQKLVLTPYARRLCAALNDISKFSRAMEDYLDAQAIKNSMGVNEPEVKRQDLDHVFLRFGRAQQ
ncbi:myosuppressin-like [Portunus trituberculatus]|nr:myosuppressin-like [Portunus trituberculatus]XP_045110729.1 myosuppressin-like [Portunus trituberculatus]ALQ28580.1 myosuppressin [Scylla paramamosain]QPO25063.1 myosuppressin [Callinectes arcuatus]